MLAKTENLDQSGLTGYNNYAQSIPPDIQTADVQNFSEGAGGADNVDVDLKYKDNWTATQRAEADVKVKVLSEANTVKTPVNRQGTSASSRYKSVNGQGSVPPKYDVDHVIDLQLGGVDDIVNMNPLDQSVNRSLGSQIQHTIKSYPDGTVFGNFNIN